MTRTPPIAVWAAGLSRNGTTGCVNYADARVPDRRTPRMSASDDSRFTVLRAPPDTAGRRALALRIVDHFARNEAENNLPVGVAAGIADAPESRENVELLLAADPEGGSAAAVVMTPPYRLLVGHGDDPGARMALLEDLRRRRVVPPGVVGTEPDSRDVALWWSQREGLEVRRAMRQGVYRLERVLPALRTPGLVRAATSEDAELLLSWLQAFWAEVGMDTGTPEEFLKAALQSAYRHLFLFEVGGHPVSMAGSGARTPRGRRVGPVYTPPEHRGKGYAEALVAEVSADLLEAGNRFCFLFTDLENPTSNAVYERIGYEMVIEAAEYDLLPRG